jgi:hypothetical protein
MGAVVGEGCAADSGSYEEYFLAGTAPLATCWVDPNLAYSDTLGIYGDSAWADYQQQRAEEDGWWARLRSRMFDRNDSLRTRRSDTLPDTLGIPPDTVPMPVDTAPDTIVRVPPPRPLGQPVRPRPDSTRPPPDTVPG